MNTPYDPLPLSDTLTPADPAAVAEAIRQAHDDGTPIYPIGGATSLGYGVCPTRPGLGLCLAKLNRLVDHATRDLTITAQAGMTMAQLGKILAKRGQRLPVDIPQADRATLGGVIAASPSGPRRLRWGTMRDYLLGVTAVDGTGMSFSSGGRVVKNAAGYYLHRLLAGSLGTLAVITQATLMVKPIPETSALLACSVPDAAAAERLLAELTHTRVVPSAVELVAGPVWHEDPALGVSGGLGWLLVGLEGTRAEVDWMLSQLADEWRRQGVASPHSVPAGHTDDLWRRLIEFPGPRPERRPERGTGTLCAKRPPGLSGKRCQSPFPDVVLHIGVLPSKTAELVARLREREPLCSIQAHAGSGILRACLPLPSEAIAGKISGELRPMVATLGGHMVVLCSPEGVSLERDTIFGSPGDGAAVMQALKDRFDPKGILNPGRFVYASS